MSWLVRLAIVGCLGVMLPGAPIYAQVAAKWVARANLPLARAETGAARLGDKIYVAAGFKDGLQPSKEAFEYSPRLNTWKTIAALPVALHHTAMAAAAGKVYVMGGVINGPGGAHPNGAEWTGSTNAFAYDIAGDKWTAIKPLPHSTAAAGVVAVDGKVYVIGGIDADGMVLDLVQCYDPATDTWSAKTAMPTKREHIGAAVLDSLIYVASGRVGNTSMVKLEAYSPKADKWTTLKEMPTQRSDIGFAAAKGKLYAMGGEKPGIFDVNEEFDPVANSWKTALKMTATRKAVSVANFEDTLFVFGGFSANGLINTVEAFVPPGGTSSRIAPGRWTEGILRHPERLGGHELINALGRLDAPVKGRGGPGNPAFAREGAGQGR